jgi:hypothetical protein
MTQRTPRIGMPGRFFLLTVTINTACLRTIEYRLSPPGPPGDDSCRHHTNNKYIICSSDDTQQKKTCNNCASQRICTFLARQCDDVFRTLGFDKKEKIFDCFSTYCYYCCQASEKLYTHLLRHPIFRSSIIMKPRLTVNIYLSQFGHRPNLKYSDR